MEKYKPQYMGKVIPADNPSKLTDFVANKYDAFTKVYEVCKDESEKIKDIKVIESDDSSNTLKVKVSSDKEVIDNIKEKSKDGKVTVDNDVITAVGDN